MTGTREKFATQIDGEVLADLRALAKAEGRQIQSLVEEAVVTLLEERRHGHVRPHVMAAYRKTNHRYSSVYEKLAR